MARCSGFHRYVASTPKSVVPRLSRQRVVFQARGVVAVRVGEAEIDVARLGDVLVAAQMTDEAEIAARARLEDVARVAAEHLARRFEEGPRVRNQPRDRDAGVGDPFFSTKQVLGHQRPIGPRQHVRVQRVDLAERRPHLADAHQDAAGQRRKRDEALFEIDAFFAERDEEIGACVRIDDGLERHLRLGHLQRRLRVHRVPAGGAEEVADDRRRRIEDVRRRRRRLAGRLRCRPGSGSAGTAAGGGAGACRSLLRGLQPPTASPRAPPAGSRIAP